LRGEPNVKFLGFVPEERVSEIFAACDVVVLPYRVVMAASGPMSHALGHRKPVLLSNEFADFRDTPLSFNLAPGALAAAIESVVNDDQRRFAILEYQEMLLREWAWDRVGSQCVAIYEAEFESRRAHLPFSRGAYSPIRLS
jgi:glycosyltransferase involved in cell wall biosynthesis